MSKFLTLALATGVGLVLAIGDAEARRLGGGKSIGKQREAISQPAPTTPPKAPTAAPGQQAAPSTPAPAPATPAPSGASRWLGPLAGLAAGTALGALLFGSGMGGLLMGLLMLAALAFGAVLLLRFLKKGAPSPHQAQTVPNIGYGDRTVREMVQSGGTQPAPATPAASHGARPDWFEDETFLRAAKVHFIRLQDAWDKKDLNDIREYTTPEMFAELKQQIMERAGGNHTDVVKLDARILDVITEGDLIVVSVHFSGQIREEENTPAQPFDEIWHIQKSLSRQGGNWFVAGIQQVQ